MLTIFGHRRSVTVAFWRYARLIHSRERHTTGKGYLGEINATLDTINTLAIEEGAAEEDDSAIDL